MGGEGVQRDLGRNEARIDMLERDLRELKDDVRAIRDAVIGVRSGWRVLALVTSASAAVGGVAAKVWSFFESQ